MAWGSGWRLLQKTGGAIAGLANAVIHKHQVIRFGGAVGGIGAAGLLYDGYLSHAVRGVFEYHGRVAQANTNGRQLYEELVPLGYDGSASTVRRVVSQWRQQRGAEVAIGRVPPPSPRWRDLRWLVLCPRQRLTDENRSRLEALLEANPHAEVGL